MIKKLILAAVLPLSASAQTLTQHQVQTVDFNDTRYLNPAMGMLRTGGAFTGAISGPRVNGVISVLGYGAVCNWNGTSGTDDTAAFNAAATAAGNLYTANGSPVTVTAPGNCVLNGTVTLPSGVHFNGNGGTVVVPDQTAGGHHATFYLPSADNVGVENLSIKVVTPCAGNDATCSAILWLPSGGDSAAHQHVYIRNVTISNADWGILVGYYGSGTGSLSDVDISGNTISSPSGGFSNADGIHIAGRVTNVTITGNRVTNRSDAAIGLSSEANGSGTAYVQSGATVTGNTLLQDRVGIDCSGCTNTEFGNNFVQSNLYSSPSNSNPAFRQIFYNSASPSVGNTACCFPYNVHTHDNYFEVKDNNDGPYAAKFDEVNFAGQTSQWPDMQSTFDHNSFGGTNGGFYLRGSGITFSDNTFWTSGASLVYAYQDPNTGPLTGNNVIGPNKWMKSGSITMGGGCGDYGATTLTPQHVVAGATLTINNLGCLGTQTFTTPGDLNVGSGSLVSSANGFLNVVPGPASSFDFVVRDSTNTTNHLIVNHDGSVNIPNGALSVSAAVQAAGFSTPNGQFAPVNMDGWNGTAALGTKLALAIPWTTPGVLTSVCHDINGDLTDNGCPAGGGGGGGSVTSVAMTTPSWLSVSGSPITAGGTLVVTATTGQTQNQILATPNGSSGAVGLRTLVNADLPAALAPTSIKATTFYSASEFSNGTCTTALTINPANGTKQKVTLTAANTCALTFTQPTSQTATVQLKITQSTSGSFNGAISGCKWPGGVVPTITQTTGAVDMLSAYLDGTNAYCQIAQSFQ